MAPLFLAMQKGYFEEEGLTVHVQTIAGGPAGVQALVAGEIQFSMNTWSSLILSRSQGLDLQMDTEISGGAKGVNAVLTGADSGVHSVADLEGKTIAINILGSVSELVLRECLRSQGLEADKYTVIELPYPNQVAAVQQGRIAAGFVPEPFVTLGLGQGLVSVIDVSTCSPTLETFPLVGMATSQKYAESNPAVVAAFARVMVKAMRLAVDHPEEVTAILPTYTTLKPDLAGKITQPGWIDPTPTLEHAEVTQKLMLEFGILKDPLPDLSVLIAVTK
jgi:NitT/TauT family transport system substrate-binding protein